MMDIKSLETHLNATLIKQRELQTLIDTLNKTTVGSLNNEINSLKNEVNTLKNTLNTLVNHNHTYIDDNGTITTEKTTGVNKNV
jgi:chromosome segregation ATPase